MALAGDADTASCLCAAFECHLSLAQRDRMWAPSRDVACLVSQWARGGVETRDAGGEG